MIVMMMRRRIMMSKRFNGRIQKSKNAKLFVSPNYHVRYLHWKAETNKKIVNTSVMRMSFHYNQNEERSKNKTKKVYICDTLIKFLPSIQKCLLVFRIIMIGSGIIIYILHDWQKVDIGLSFSLHNFQFVYFRWLLLKMSKDEWSQD